VKSRPEPGLWLEEIPSRYWINDVLIRVSSAPASVVPTSTSKSGTSGRARPYPFPWAIGHEFVGRIEAVGSNVADFFPGDIVSGEGHVVCGDAQLLRRPARHLCARTTASVSTAWAHSPNTSPSHDESVATPKASISMWRPFRPLRQRRPTARSFPVLGEDVLITGAGPIGSWPPPLPPTQARDTRHHRPQPLSPRAAKKLGVTHAVDVARQTLAEVQKALGMTEGSTSASKCPAARRLPRHARRMSHGARIAMLGIPAAEMSIDWRTVIFNMLTIRASTAAKCMRPGTR